MSSRALRKLQREKEEKDLARQAEEQEEDNSDGHVRQQSNAKPSAFALLGDVDDDEDDDENDDQNGVPIEHTDLHTPKPAQTSQTSSTSSSKKKKKKKKAKAQQNAKLATDVGSSDELDEIDRALKSLATSDEVSQSVPTAAGVEKVTAESNRLLGIDTTHLHAQNEMKRLFGRAALENDDGEEDGQNAPNVGGNRRQQRRLQQVGLAQALRGQGGVGGRSTGLAAAALRRNPFIQGKAEWPVATGGGLGMEVEQKATDGTVLYRFVHNRVYQDVQAQFDVCVESMDPNRLVMLLRHNPYHISTLLQVSEIAKQERDHATSGDLLERALFSFGRAVHSTFLKNMAEGNARLDFARPENREFWLASWRYMQNLAMRATWRTVYEWARLLLSLSPHDDPYALWLTLDQYALRARRDLDYLNISRDSTFQKVHQHMPNVQMSQALAELRAGNHGKGKQALFSTIGRYPWFAARLIQELGIDPPPALWGKQPDTDKERLYAELYAVRAKDLWNTPESISLLTEVASAIPPETPAAPAITDEITRNEARHVILSDAPALIALVPRKYTVAVESTSDPLPPVQSLTSYSSTSNTRASRTDVTSGNATETHAQQLWELQQHYQFFSRIFPWFSRRNDPSGAAGQGLGTDDLSEEEVQRAIEEAGVSEEDLVERATRMAELRELLVPERLSAATESGASAVANNHMTVEDVSDEEDGRA